MNDEDRPRFGLVMLALAEVFQQKITPGAVALYFEALDDMSIERVEAAGRRLIKTFRQEFGRKLPVPADFYDADEFGAHEAAPMLESAPRTNEEREAARSMARAKLDEIRAALRSGGGPKAFPGKDGG